jgi:hypothetical protein
MTYTSTRQIAKNLGTSTDSVTKLANELNLGTVGAFKNSPRTFDPLAAVTLEREYFNRKTGELRNKILSLQSARLRNAELMAGLAGLAAAYEPRVGKALVDIGLAAAKVRRSGGNDITTRDGKAKFLNSINRDGADLDAALRNLTATL